MSTQRESSWRTARRCFAMVCRAQRGLATLQDLIAAVYDTVGADAYGDAQGETLYKKARKDIERTRDNLTIALRFDRRERAYRIYPGGTPLLDLPDADLQIIAWLEQTFTPDAPHYNQLQHFLAHLRLYLPLDHQPPTSQASHPLTLDLNRRDDNHVLPHIRQKLIQAIHNNHQVDFEYFSSSSPDGKLRRHVVDPYEHYFERGHYYLKGWCHYTVSDAHGRTNQEKYIRYRLERIQRLTILPKRRLPARKASKYKVIYKLSHNIVRGGISRQRWIDFDPERDIEYLPDGSAIVSGTTDNNFFALQALMPYRAECEILGDAKMRREAVEAVRRMAEIYKEEI